jgi:hypothetical protein
MASKICDKEVPGDFYMDKLVYFEYRHFRFIYNPVTGLFEGNYGWRDYKWGTDSLTHQITSQTCLMPSTNLQIQKWSSESAYLERTQSTLRKSLTSGCLLTRSCIRSLCFRSAQSFFGVSILITTMPLASSSSALFLLFLLWSKPRGAYQDLSI